MQGIMHQISLLAANAAFDFSLRLFGIHNHFHSHVNDTWAIVFLENISIIKNGLYDALIGFCDDVGIVQCNYDIYLSEHEGGAANLVMLKKSISGFYVSLLRLEFIIKLLA
jgi:hypothetical protein